jgi:phosphomannomutase
MADPQIKFGTDGWRSRMDQDFTVPNLAKVAAAAANYVKGAGLGDRCVLIGHDTRNNSRLFAETAARVISAAGIRACLVNKATPTPAIAFGVLELNAAAGIQITASHNPAIYNGFKFIPYYGGPAFPEITAELERLIHVETERKSAEAADKGVIEEVNLKARYLDFVKRDLDLTKVASLDVVLDPLFGAGIGYLSEFLKANGAKTRELHSSPDPNFGGLSPDPVEENLKELSKTVVETGADLGIANDGDADRIAVVDESGGFYSAIELSVLVSDYLIGVKKKSGYMAKSVCSTHALDRIAAKYGVKIVETPVGFKYHAMELMKGAMFASDGFGGLGYGWGAPEKDGILSGAIMAELVAHYEEPLSAVWKRVSKEYGFGSYLSANYEVTDDAKKRVKAYAANPPGEINGRKVVKTVSIDGIKLILDNGSWVLMRPSGTEPLLRIYAEAATKKGAQMLAKEAVKLVVG